MPQAALALAEPHPAVALMARETRVRRGAAPRAIAGHEVGRDQFLLAGDAYLMRSADGIAIHYRRGEGVTVDAPDDADPRDLDLWLHGSVHAAVAAINGLLPIHASAVVSNGRVHAVSGPAGAGKSTLAAGLGNAGLPLFCDDTLILDVSGEGPVECLPGHKRLKLWPEGVALAGAAAGQLVARDYPKHFAEPAAGSVEAVLPLAEIVFLEPGERPELCPIAAGERIARLQDDHYTAKLFAQAGGLSRRERFAQLARIAARVPMRRFARPFDPARFGEGCRFVATAIRGAAR
ncbi:MAG: hypothetical protein LC648_09455 [Novosphingobium sp.]|nr:hypothetical protein [Novosphingobium sp.]